MKTSTHIYLVALLGVLLSLHLPTAFAQSPTSVGAMEMKAFVEPAYKLAMTIDAQKALLKSLKRAAEQKRLVKIPVVIVRAADGLGAWQSAYIGTDAAASDPIQIRLDDSALGVSLADRIHQYCAEAQSCKLWLVGYWEDRMVRYDECSPNLKRRQLQLSIRHVVGPQAEGDAAVAYIAK